jgi:predicted phosphohydrolase
MKLFAIGDLHLSFRLNKPMDIFGPEWIGHAQKIADNWRETVGPEDVVFVVGDVSWAMRIQDAAPDFDWIGRLPGRKILIKGNHDYWWSKISRISKWLPEGIHLLQGTSLRLNGVVVVGTRGWTIPGSPMFEEQRDRRVYNRECLRLENALSSLGNSNRKPIVALLHFPPLMSQGEPTCFTRILERYGASICLFGHLHGEDRRWAFEGLLNGVRYRMVSCDHINFSPALIELKTN